jgi:hypothetical protein
MLPFLPYTIANPPIIAYPKPYEPQASSDICVSKAKNKRIFDVGGSDYK